VRFKSPRDEPLELIAIAGPVGQTDERTPSSECAGNYRLTNDRQIEVGSDCCCYCCCWLAASVISRRQDPHRPSAKAKQLNAGQA